MDTKSRILAFDAAYASKQAVVPSKHMGATLNVSAFVGNWYEKNAQLNRTMVNSQTSIENRQAELQKMLDEQKIHEYRCEVHAIVGAIMYAQYAPIADWLRCIMGLFEEDKSDFQMFETFVNNQFQMNFHEVTKFSNNTGAVCSWFKEMTAEEHNLDVDIENKHSAKTKRGIHLHLEGLVDASIDKFKSAVIEAVNTPDCDFAVKFDDVLKMKFNYGYVYLEKHTFKVESSKDLIARLTGEQRVSFAAAFDNIMEKLKASESIHSCQDAAFGDTGANADNSGQKRQRI